MLAMPGLVLVLVTLLEFSSWPPGAGAVLLESAYPNLALHLVFSFGLFGFSVACRWGRLRWGDAAALVFLTGALPGVLLPGAIWRGAAGMAISMAGLAGATLAGQALVSVLVWRLRRSGPRQGHKRA